MIEIIKKKFVQEKYNGSMSETDKTLPLQILNPDNNGRTAVFLAIQSQSPQSFEYMIEMLSDFPDYCISKMILKSLFVTFTHPSDTVLTFFDENIF